MIKKGGMIHNYLKKKEKKLYAISDYIGCMSPANVDYVIRHNPEINPNKIEINPNSIEPDCHLINNNEKLSIREQFGIPAKAIVFIYGGNLGKPQGIDFLLEVLNNYKGRKDVFFVIVGNGTEYSRVQSWFSSNNPAHAKLISGLPKNEYDEILQACDVGLIFLDKRFTIPNFPSRLLSYLEFKLPVIAATDRNTDIGEIMEDNKFGFWAESGDLTGINMYINKLTQNHDLITKMGQKGFKFLLENYTVSNSYSTISKHFR